MTPADVQALRDNVNVKKLPWAVKLFEQARADADANPPVLQTTDTTAVCTPQPGFSELGSATASPSGVTRTIHQAYRIINAAAPQRATATLSTAGFWTAAVVTYRAG